MSKLNKYVLIFASLPVLVLVISFLRHGPPPDVQVEIPLAGDIQFVTNRRDSLAHVQALAVAFTELHPEVTIKVVLHDTPEDSLPPLMVKGQTPDVTIVPNSLTRAQYPDYFLPVDELPFDSSKIRFYLDGKGPDGHLYSLSSQVNYVGLVYSRRAFATAGIEHPPTDRASFQEACAKLAAAQIVPLEVNAGELWSLDRYVLYLPAMLSGNPSAVNVLARRDALFAADTPLLTVFERLRAMAESGCLGTNWQHHNWTSSKSQHAAGGIGMMLLGSWYPAQLQALGARRQDLGAFPFPGSQAVLIVSDWHFAVSADTLYPRAAKAFLEYLIEGGRYARAVGGNSPLLDVPPGTACDRELLASGLPTLEMVPQSDAFRERTANAKVSLAQALREYLAADDPAAVLAKYNARWAEAGAKPATGDEE